MRYLTEAEQTELRKEYQQREDEIQKNIAVYLSALVVVVGWVFAPQAKPVVQTVVGNDGLNIIGILILLGVNAIFTSFLVYKSVQIHEVMQFLSVFAAPDSGWRYWEYWRRSKHALTKQWGTRAYYMVAIGFVPGWISLIGLVGTYVLISQAPADLAMAVMTSQVSSATAQSNLTPATPPKDVVQRVANNLAWAKSLWRFILAIHYVPLLFVFVSWIAGGRKWREVQKLPPDLSAIDDLTTLKLSLPVIPTAIKPSTAPRDTAHEDVVTTITDDGRSVAMTVVARRKGSSNSNGT